MGDVYHSFHLPFFKFLTLFNFKIVPHLEDKLVWCEAGVNFDDLNFN